MSDRHQEADQALRKAKIELKAGNRRSARRFAQLAASFNPDAEEPWLILAALSTPKSSIKHLNRALRINSNSKIARKGLEWATQKIHAAPTTKIQVQRPRVVSPVSAESLTQSKSYSAPWLFLALIILGAFFIWYRVPIAGALFKPADALPEMQFQIDKETRTPTPTFTFTPLPTSTNTPVPTATPTDTEVPTATPSNTPKPTKKPTPKPAKQNSKKSSPQSKAQIAKRPKGIGAGEHWVDVDLSSQTAHALSGDDLVKSFVVSTGTWMHPTVTGTFKVYVKYRYANMSGPGYFLPNVPYVMYFYKDYGLHGTYWHHNFGTPMSHGCINFKTDDAAWLFNFASIGTIVNIHQ
jgi:lipoprotein-anchoring transpeptidase ErfK/SrfK